MDRLASGTPLSVVKTVMRFSIKCNALMMMALVSAISSTIKLAAVLWRRSVDSMDGSWVSCCMVNLTVP